MNIKQVCEILKLSRNRVVKMVQAGELKCEKVYNGNATYYMFDDAYIRAFALTYVRKGVGRPKGSREVKMPTPSVQSAAFKIFASGGDWRQVVIDCGIGINAAVDLWRKYSLEPHQVEALEKMQRQEADHRARVKESNAAERRDVWRKHQVTLAELRARAPAPILTIVPRPSESPEPAIPSLLPSDKAATSGRE